MSHGFLPDVIMRTSIITIMKNKNDDTSPERLRCQKYLSCVYLELWMYICSQMIINVVLNKKKHQTTDLCL